MALNFRNIPESYDVLRLMDDGVLAMYKGMLVFAQNKYTDYNQTLINFNDGIRGVLYNIGDGATDMVLEKFKPLTKTPFSPGDYGVKSPHVPLHSVQGSDMYDALFLISDELFGISWLKELWIDGTNLNQFNQLMQEGVYNELEAAAFTFAGMQAEKHGFRPVKVLDRDQDLFNQKYNQIIIAYARE